jgi:hypothetical protein
MRRRVFKALVDPLFLLQIIALIIMVSGLIHVVFNQVAIRRDIRAIQHHIGARP